VAFFLGSTYAGHATRFANLRAHASADERIRPVFREVSGWRESGRLERLPLLPRAVKGRLRIAAEVSRYGRFPRPDVIWTSCRAELAPMAWANLGPLHRPLVIDLDATNRQLESMAKEYWGRRPRGGLSLKRSLLAEQLHWRPATVFTPWSRWAAQGLEREGVDPAKIKVMPPGVDLGAWRPARKASGDRPLRLLFVGGDFERKGGSELLGALAQRPGEFEAALVTRATLSGLPPYVRVVPASPNSPELKALFDWADIFVLPTRADCFGIATVEAMAAGLPVIATNVGGAGDIVEDGVTGWLIDVGTAPLRTALSAAVERRAELTSIGGRGRERAERLFDGAANDAAIVELLSELAASA
jgi:glycosyltransferase involved in cell wall biosynthesis